MRRIIRSSVWCVLFALAVPAGAAAAARPQVPATELAAAAQNRFAVALYHRLAADTTGGNVFFSPYSVFVALAMAAEGARGQTALEMGMALGLPPSLRRQGLEAATQPWDLGPVHDGLGAFARAIGRRGAADTVSALSVASSLWGDAATPFGPDFLRTLGEHYGTDGVRTEDFLRHPEAAREHVNAWVAGQTRQRILDLLPPGSVDRLTRLVLVNAIYFKGAWAEPFNESLTHEGPFRLADGSEGRAPLMQRMLPGGRYGAFGADGGWFATPREVATGVDDRPGNPALYPGRGGFQVLELPYRGGDLSMVVLLPSSPADLATLESGLTASRLAEWIGRLESRAVWAKLPRYRLEQARELTTPLRAMGMTLAFTDRAQFGGMATPDDPDHEFQVGGVFHKAFLEVNERGAEAAAATGVAMSEVSVRQPRATRPFVPVFVADHPFLFLIRDVGTGNILFMGRYSRP